MVLEQTLGHVVHTANLVRVAQEMPDMRPRPLRIAYDDNSWRRGVPVLGNWSLEASWRARRAVLGQLRERPAGAMLVHTQVPALFLGDVMHRIPTVISTDATPTNIDSVGSSYGHRVQSDRMERLKRRAVQRALASAATVVAWSRWAADSLASDYGVPADRLRIIPAGVDVDRFSPDPRRPEPGAPARILFVGGDFARKGGDDLLAAAAALDSPVELDIVTNAALPPLPPNVRVHRGLTHDSAELFELFRRADVFALPSRGECSPLAVVEAMASGLPVVSTSVGAIPELVRDGHDGLLVPAASPRHLAQALRVLVERPELRRSMGARGRERACRDLDANRNSAQLLGLLRELSSTADGSLRQGEHPSAAFREHG